MPSNRSRLTGLHACKWQVNSSSSGINMRVSSVTSSHMLRRCREVQHVCMCVLCYSSFINYAWCSQCHSLQESPARRTAESLLLTWLGKEVQCICTLCLTQLQHVRMHTAQLLCAAAAGKAHSVIACRRTAEYAAALTWLAAGCSPAVGC